MTPTPAQIAYEAYMAVLALSFPMDFAALPDTYRRAWEAAAEAVRDLVMQDLITGGAQARLERQARQEETRDA